MPVAAPGQYSCNLPVRNSVGTILLSFALLLPCAAAAQQAYYPPGIDLPDGTARELVLQACTRCHDLKGVPAFKGYWTRQQWLAMIETMIRHGAPLDAVQAARVADYLAQHYGRQPVLPAPATE